MRWSDGRISKQEVGQISTAGPLPMMAICFMKPLVVIR